MIPPGNSIVRLACVTFTGTLGIGRLLITVMRPGFASSSSGRVMLERNTSVNLLGLRKEEFRTIAGLGFGNEIMANEEAPAVSPPRASFWLAECLTTTRCLHRVEERSLPSKAFGRTETRAAGY